MNDTEIETAARQLVANVLNIELAQVATLRREMIGWDSLKHVEIVFALEDHFGIEIAEESLAEIDGIPGIVRVVGPLIAA